MDNNQAIPSILIVDDNPKNIQVLGKALQSQNYELESATSGIDTLEWLKTKKFDLLLLDINMPEMSGFEVCEKIRSDHSLDIMPIIFLTAYTDRNNILKGFELGAQDYITKPFDTAELTARIKTHLELKLSKDKLKNVNTWLEEKVKEKTHELTEANTKLNETLNKIKKLDKLKNNFLQLSSTEIRIPLNKIISTLHILKNQDVASSLNELIEMLGKSISKMENFAKRAILTSELDSDSYEYKMEKINLANLIKYRLLEHNDEIVKKNIQVIDKIDNSIFVNAEKELLSNLFSFIIGNAVSNTPNNKMIEIEIVKSESKVKCKITDNGDGFILNDKDDSLSVFDSNETEYRKVNYLSIYLAKLIADLHNGELLLYNKDGVGGVVEIIFNEQ